MSPPLSAREKAGMTTKAERADLTLVPAWCPPSTPLDRKPSGVKRLELEAGGIEPAIGDAGRRQMTHSQGLFGGSVIRHHYMSPPNARILA